MKKLKSSNGFTLVELIVVIAMLAILSSVSIGGFEYSQKRAAIQNDKALVKQLNQVLDSYSIFTHNEGAIHDALIEEFGNTIEIQSLKFGYDIYCYIGLCEFYLLDESVYKNNENYLNLRHYLNLQTNDSIPSKERIDLINYDTNKTYTVTMKFDIDTYKCEHGELDASTLGELSNLECNPIDLVNYYQYTFAESYEIVDKNIIKFYRPGVYLLTYKTNDKDDFLIVFVKNTYVLDECKTDTPTIELNNLNYEFSLENINNNYVINVLLSNITKNIYLVDYYRGSSHLDEIKVSENGTQEIIYREAMTIIVEINGVYQSIDIKPEYPSDYQYQLAFDNIQLDNSDSCNIFIRYLAMNGLWYDSNVLTCDISSDIQGE